MNGFATRRHLETMRESIDRERREKDATFKWSVILGMVFGLLIVSGFLNR